MSGLASATTAQLVAWQRAIVDELARRAAPPAPVAAAPPWEQEYTPAPRMPIYEPPPPATVDQQVAQLRAELAAARASAAPRGAPAMLGGQIRPGVVIATERTDPALAARFAATPIRQEGISGVQGRGHGEGEATFDAVGRYG